MALRTDPARFSITAFLADQVTLVARHENLSPGQAVLRLQELSRDGSGRKRLLEIVGEASRHESNPRELSKLAALRSELAAWASSPPTGAGH